MRVLIVEDDRLVRSALRRLIAHLGHDVLEAEDGVVGLRLLDTPVPFDIVISDIRMPGASGIDVATAARRCGAARVILMTAYVNDEHREAARALGVELLEKPFPPQIVFELLGGTVTVPVQTWSGGGELPVAAARFHGSERE